MQLPLTASIVALCCFHHNLYCSSYIGYIVALLPLSLFPLSIPDSNVDVPAVLHEYEQLKADRLLWKQCFPPVPKSKFHEVFYPHVRMGDNLPSSRVNNLRDDLVEYDHKNGRSSSDNIPDPGEGLYKVSSPCTKLSPNPSPGPIMAFQTITSSGLTQYRFPLGLFIFGSQVPLLVIHCMFITEP